MTDTLPTIGQDPWGEDLNAYLNAVNSDVMDNTAALTDHGQQIAALQIQAASMQQTIDTLRERSVVSAAYKYTRIAGATAGQIGLQPGWSNPSVLNISDTVFSGAEPAWDLLLPTTVSQVGRQVRLRDPLDSTHFAIVILTGEGVDQGAYMQYPVSLSSSQLSDPAPNDSIVLDLAETFS